MNVRQAISTPSARVLSRVSLVAAVLLPWPALAQDNPAPAVEPAPLVPPPTEVLAPAPATATEAPAAPAPSAGIVLNFQGAPLVEVLNYLSEAADFVIVHEAPVSGTVNIVSRQPINAEETVDLLNSVLYEKGYTAIRNGRILKIVSRTNAPKRDLPVEMGADPERIPRKDEMVTQILPLRFGEAAKLIENLRPLLAESATISANEASNAILLTDTQANIRRIAQIIRALDTSVSSISSIQIFQLQFADAKAVADVVTQLFSAGQTSSSSAASQGGGRGWGRRGFGFPGFGGGNAPASTPQSEARQAASRVVAVADEQSNSLVVSAPEETMSTIRDIITQIDTSIVDITDTRIFRLLHADAVELADIVNNLYAEIGTQGTGVGGSPYGRGDRGDRRPRGPQAGTGQRSERALLQSRVVAVGDPRTNSLVVTAAQETMLQISEVITRLDATDAKKQRVYVHSLQHADAENVANVLRGMLGQQTTGPGGLPNGTSRLTERTATGATMDANDALSSGRSTR